TGLVAVSARNPRAHMGRAVLEKTSLVVGLETTLADAPAGRLHHGSLCLDLRRSNPAAGFHFGSSLCACSTKPASCRPGFPFLHTDQSRHVRPEHHRLA